MKKILYVLSTLRQCGPVKQTLNIIKYLDRKKFSPVLLTLSPEPEDSMKDMFEKQGVRLIRRNAGWSTSLLSARHFRRDIFGEVRPDLIHVHGLRADLIFRGFREVPVLTTLRNDPVAEYKNRYGIPGLLIARLHVKAVGNMGHAVACSDFVAGRYEKLLGKRTGLISNGIDTREYKCGDVSKDETLKGKRIFVFTGNLTKRKDPVTLIEGFLKSSVADTSVLIILGDGKDFTKMRQTYEGDNVRFMGWIRDVLTITCQADYFISASTAEGLPNGVLEAMAAGLPVILSDIAPHRQLVEGRKTGWLFKTGSSESLAGLLDNLNPSERDTFGDNGRKLVCGDFGAENMSGKYQKLYADLTGK